MSAEAEIDVVSPASSSPLQRDTDTTIKVRSGFDEMDLTAALCVRNGFKSYGKGNPILQDFNMTVPAGCIYSLLGSSGCGKTTILSCCVGIKKLDEGAICVFGKKPGTKESGVPGRKVGFMPQDLSLYDELTIQEAMNFYGRVYGMRREHLKESTVFLIDFLDLPSASRRIGNLSGGQRRRVSMALTLIHDPELLILDEPTVGVDPLLREGIWGHLVDLVKTGRTTVIITTHYVQEARHSDMVGLMRNGRLLVEKTPAALISEFGVNNLEDIVLSLCRQDRTENRAERSAAELKKSNNPLAKPNKAMAVLNCFNFIRPIKQGKVQSAALANQNPAPNREIHRTSETDTQEEEHELGGFQDSISNVADTNSNDKGSLNRVTEEEDDTQPPPVRRRLSTRESIRLNQSTCLKRLIALLVKNCIILMRNIGFLLFIFFVPAVQVVLICYTMGSDPRGLLISVVNPEPCDFQSSNWRNIRNLCPFTDDILSLKDTLSCFYLSVLPEESFLLEKINSSSDAIDRMRLGYTYGYIQFPDNYTKKMMCRYLLGGLQIIGCGLNVVDANSIILEADLSNKHIGQTMKKIFIETYGKVMGKIKSNCMHLRFANLIESAASLPYQFKKPLFGKDDSSFKEFLAPSILLGLLFFFPLCSSAISYIIEKKTGTLDRALVAGVTTTEIMGGFLIVQMGILLGQAGFAFLILTQVFKIEIHGSILLALSLTILVGISGMSAGFLMAMFCKDEVQAVLLAIGTFFPNILLAGMVWPLEGMERGVQYISYMLPCTLACESMRSIISRGWGFQHRRVWPGFLTTLAWIIVYWLLALFIHRLKSKS